MPVAVDNRGLASVNKSFVSQHKKELLLVAGLVAGVALGLFVSPELGIGVAAVSFFTYLSADLLSPSIGPRKIKQQQKNAHDEWDVERRVEADIREPESVSNDPEFAQMVAEHNALPRIQAVASGLSRKFLPLGPRQSPGIEIVGEGGSIEAIQPPSPTTQSRELSRGSKCQEFTGKTTRINDQKAKREAARQKAGVTDQISKRVTY